MEMKELETALRQALAESDPPEGFAHRVLARVAREGRGAKAQVRWQKWLLGAAGFRWALAGALCAALAVGAVVYQQRQRRIEGERAKQQLMLALRITAASLQQARADVLRASSGTQQREGMEP